AGAASAKNTAIARTRRIPRTRCPRARWAKRAVSAAARAASSHSLEPMKIEMLNVGWFSIGAGVMRRGEDPERGVRRPVPAYVIETAEERILVDTGLHPAAVRDAAAHYGRPDAYGPFQVEQEASVADQVDLGSLTKVVLTHLHFDHAGGLALLPRSTPVFIQ